MSMPTLGRPYVPTAVPAPSAKRRGVLLPVAGLVVLALLAVITVGLLQQAVGTAGVIVGTLAALLPVVPVVAAFLWVDRWEPEPPRMLMGAFLWGAGFAALVSLLINTSASAVLDAAAGRGAGDLFGPVVIAPFVEEFAKGLFLVGLLVFRRREFDGLVDGVVYAGITAAGFAFTENILYLGRAVSEPETAGVLATLFMRGIASPFAHPLFTCMMGIAIGLTASHRSVVVRVLALLAGYLAAVVLHALWNGASVLAATPGAFFQIYLFVMVPLFVGLLLLVVMARRREARVVAAQLPGFASAGWIAPSEVPLLARLSRRKGWRALVRRRSGRAAAKAVAEYQAAVTELAFMRDRIARGAVRDSARTAHDEKLAALLAARATAIGRPDSAVSLTAAWRIQPPPGWQPPPPPAADGSFSGQYRIPADLRADPPGAPGHGSAGHGATPGPGAPGPGAPGRPAPGHGPPQHGAPQHGAPQHGAPQHGAAQHGAAQHGAPGYGPPGPGGQGHRPQGVGGRGPGHPVPDQGAVPTTPAPRPGGSPPDPRSGDEQPPDPARGAGRHDAGSGAPPPHAGPTAPVRRPDDPPGRHRPPPGR